MKPGFFGVALVCILTSLELLHGAKLLQESSARVNFLGPPSDDARPATIGDLLRAAEGADASTDEITKETPLQQAKSADDATDQATQSVRRVPLAQLPLQQADVDGADDAADQAMEVLRELPFEGSQVTHVTQLPVGGSQVAQVLRELPVHELLQQAHGVQAIESQATQVTEVATKVPELPVDELLQQAHGVHDTENQVTEVAKTVQELLQQADGVHDTESQVTQVMEVVKKVPAENLLAGPLVLALPIDVSTIVALAEENPHTSNLVRNVAKHPESKETTAANRRQRETGNLLQSASHLTKADATAAVREALEENGVADDPKLRKLEHSLVGLARMPDSNATKMIVDEMRHLVQNVLLEEIIKQTQTAEQQVSELIRRFPKCSNMTSYRLQTLAMPNWNNYSRNHRSCRADQAAMSTPTEELWRRVVEAEKHMNESCHWYNDVTNVIPSADECGVPPPNGMRRHIAGLIDKFRVRMQGVMLERKGCENATRVYEYRRRQYMLSNASVDLKKEECDGLQLEMDVAACDFKAEVVSICKEYHQCYDRTNCASTAAMETAHKLVESLRPEYNALKRIECIILEWLANNLEDGIEICRNKTFEPLELNLTGLDVPSVSSCHAPTKPWTIHHPTSQEYKRQEYARLPPNAQADTCRAWCCVTPA